MAKKNNGKCEILSTTNRVLKNAIQHKYAVYDSVQIEVWQKVCRSKNTSSHAYRGWIRGISYFLCSISGTKKTICRNILDNLEHFQDFKSSFQDVKSLNAKRRCRVHRDCRCKETEPCTCNPDELCAPPSFAQTKRKTSLLRTFLWARSPSAITRSATSTHAVQLSLTFVLLVIKICLPPTKQPTNKQQNLSWIRSKSWISKIKNRFRIIQVFADQDSKKCTFCCRIQDMLTNSSSLTSVSHINLLVLWLSTVANHLWRTNKETFPGDTLLGAKRSS